MQPVESAIPNNPVILYLTEQAANKARSDIEWAQANIFGGEAHFRQRAFPAAIAAFKATSSRLTNAKDADSRYHYALAVFNTGAALTSLGYYRDAIDEYDVFLERSTTETDLPVLELVAKTYYNKAGNLISAGLLEEALTVFKTMLARFSSSTELSL